MLNAMPGAKVSIVGTWRFTARISKTVAKHRFCASDEMDWAVGSRVRIQCSVSTAHQIETVDWVGLQALGMAFLFGRKVKHLPACLCNYHFGAQLMEFIPKLLRFQMTLHRSQIITVTRAAQSRFNLWIENETRLVDWPCDLNRDRNLTWPFSGVDRSSSDGHGGDAIDVGAVLLVLRDGALESLHCSTSTSSSTSAYRSIDSGPDRRVINYI